MEVVTQDMLEEVASLMPTASATAVKPSRNEHREFDLEGWIEKQGIKVRRESEWGRGGYRWVLEECPWNGHADKAAFIVRLPGGAIAAGCHHNSCQGKGWRELREHYESGAYDKNGWSDTHSGYHGDTYEAGPSLWPELDEAAFYGLPGEIVRAMEPHSEADPIALLVSLLDTGGEPQQGVNVVLVQEPAPHGLSCPALKENVVWDDDRGRAAYLEQTLDVLKEVKLLV